MSNIIEVKVPDLGGAPKADVIAINVKVGDVVAVDDALVTLEGDKASMDIPSPQAGIVKDITLSLGDKVSEGALILLLEDNDSSLPSSSPEIGEDPVSKIDDVPVSGCQPVHGRNEGDVKKEILTAISDVYAGPLVRRMAREMNIDLTTVQGTARNGRITKEDIQNQYQEISATCGDQWGETASFALNKIKRLTAENMLRNWTTIPHVTQFEQADITELENFREKHKHKTEKDGYKLTPLAFVVKAIAHALKVFPTFNASLDDAGENLILKKYYHIGIAVDTPNGLVVPVLRDVDKKSVRDIAKEMGVVSAKARDKALLPKDMMGSSFTVSSLGGIGGTAFTPIINAPNVAILGLSKSKIQPVFSDGQFVPRLMLPLSLSYDHRVIDGAEAARFIVYLSTCLEDLKLLLL